MLIGHGNDNKINVCLLPVKQKIVLIIYLFVVTLGIAGPLACIEVASLCFL